MTRIVHLSATSVPQVGGAEVLVHTLVAAQARQGHEVTVVSRWPILRLRRQVPYAVVPLVPTTFRRAGRAALGPDGPRLLGRQMRRLQKRRAFDVWHVHMAHPTGWAAAGPLRALGVASVLTAHGADLMIDPTIDYGHRREPWIDERIRRTVGQYGSVVAVNQEIRAIFADLGVAADRIHLIPNGVPVPEQVPSPVDRLEARRRLGLPEVGPVVLTVARHDPRVKGLDLVPGAAATVGRDRPGLVWMVTGRGVEAMAGPVTAAGAAAVVRLDGARRRRAALDWPESHVLDAYRAADVFVLPSRVEASPLVVLEAMACGLPVVVADVPGCRDLVRDDVTGRVVPSGDGAALAAAVTGLLGDPVRRARLGAAARAQAVDRSVDAVATAHDAVYAHARRVER